LDLEKVRNHPFARPVIFSLILHLALIAASMFIYMQSHSEIAEKNSPFFKVKSVETNPMALKRQGPFNTRQFVNALRSAQGPVKTSAAVKDIPLESVLEKRVFVEEASKDIIPQRSQSASASVLHSRDFENVVVRTEERQLKEKIPFQEKPTVGLLSRMTGKVVGGSKLDDQNILRNLQKSLASGDFYSPANMGVNPEEGMPGFTPSASDAGGEEGISADKATQEPKDKVVQYESLDDFMDIEVYTYENLGYPQKYYMIKIFAKKGANVLKVMPKEILFTIDASLSISSRRLEEFKKGIQYCLSNLNPGDLFNIVAFKDKTFFFSPQSLPATPQTIKEAERFVSSLTASERTDVYAAFDGIVKLPLERRPSNVVLISDGRPTYGIVNSRDLINSITRINERKRPVFAYSGGAKVNRYLLDFIAYQNRGWAEFVREIPKIDDGLAAFYDKIRDPLFLNLRYRLSGLGENNVFPKSLPDFYRNAEFTLFGTYTDEDKFSMQLLGDIDGKTKELIFSRSLSEAKKGTADIMRGYAFNRIYYLISRVTTEGSNTELLREINELSRRYSVVTPYSPELEKTD